MGSRVGWRLFAAFVLVALVPLAASDWLSSAAVDALAHQLDHGSREQRTRAVSLQVFGRLLAAETLLLALPVDGTAPGGAQRMFTALAACDAHGVVRWASANGGSLPMRWARAATPKVVTPHSGVSLRVSSGAHPSILLARMDGTRPRWIGALRPGYLWAPLRDATGEAAWQVDGANGRVLERAGSAHGGNRSWRHTLFLGAEFGAPDWTFVQSAPALRVMWSGRPLTVWLGLVAATTLLGIALLVLWQIRRITVPLERLMLGTRQLNAGAVAAPVEVSGNDEFAQLAQSFNVMSTRLAAQFEALTALAAFDRDILRGASMDALVAAVLGRLENLQPGIGACVAWRETSRRLRLCATGATPRDIDLDAHDAAAWDALDASSPPPWWLREALNGAPQGVLPLRRQGQLQALIALGPGADAASLPQAAELRDRLAVALAVRARERELVHQATHDSLTGLLNRDGLYAQLDGELRGTAQLAILYLDLDHFKDVNDNQGHDVGDTLLREAAARLRALLPDDALVARQGGDEFVIALPGADAQTAQRLANAAVARLAEPFAVGSRPQTVGASIGIALSPQHGRDRDALQRCADLALYAAKARGRGRAVLFDPALGAYARSRVELIADMRQALQLDQFVAYFQPRVAAGDAVVRSAEALARWRRADGELLGPAAFIELAEASGLIVPLGLRMLDLACAQMARWQGRGIQRVSVNVSPLQLIEGDLVDHVVDSLQRHALPASALELEVTETILVGDTEHAFAQLAALRQRGVRIALDDFGTGYSSMAALRKLPIDVMKVDRSFVTELGRDPTALAVVRAIIALAKASGLLLVAEGVENEAQAQILRELGCDELQGFLYCRPVPAEQVPLG